MMDSTMAGEFNRISEGNPGALTVMFALTRTQHTDTIVMMDELGITGSKIWMLYKDQCGEDIDKLVLAVREQAAAAYANGN